MLEQEIASIIQFTLLKAGNPSPYYYEVPEGFLVPSIYFPVPEVASGGWTLRDYSLSYLWFIKIFHKDRPSAQELALAVLTAIKERRGVIPLIDTNGALTGRGFRLKDPETRPIDGQTGTIQLTLSWDSARPYIDVPAQKMMTYDLNLYSKAAYAAATGQEEPVNTP